MLGDYPLQVVLLSLDLGETRTFYHDQLGLEIVSESDDAITFRSGGTPFAVTISTVGTADEQTQASWFVNDLDAELATLRANGVTIEDYDMPGLKTVDGVADLGFARAAWVIDPHRNTLGILQRN